MLVAAYLGYKGTGNSPTQYSMGGNDARELSGEFTTVKAETDPLLSQFRYDPDTVFVLDTVH